MRAARAARATHDVCVEGPIIPAAQPKPGYLKRQQSDESIEVSKLRQEVATLKHQLKKNSDRIQNNKQAHAKVVAPWQHQSCASLPVHRTTRPVGGVAALLGGGLVAEDVSFRTNRKSSDQQYSGGGLYNAKKREDEQHARMRESQIKILKANKIRAATERRQYQNQEKIRYAEEKIARSERKQRQLRDSQAYKNEQLEWKSGVQKQKQIKLGHAAKIRRKYVLDDQQKIKNEIEAKRQRAKGNYQIKTQWENERRERLVNEKQRKDMAKKMNHLEKIEHQSRGVDLKMPDINNSRNRRVDSDISKPPGSWFTPDKSSATELPWVKAQRDALKPSIDEQYKHMAGRTPLQLEKLNSRKQKQKNVKALEIMKEHVSRAKLQQNMNTQKIVHTLVTSAGKTANRAGASCDFRTFQLACEKAGLDIPEIQTKTVFEAMGGNTGSLPVMKIAEFLDKVNPVALKAVGDIPKRASSWAEMASINLNKDKKKQSHELNIRKNMLIKAAQEKRSYRASERQSVIDRNEAAAKQRGIESMTRRKEVHDLMKERKNALNQQIENKKSANRAETAFLEERAQKEKKRRNAALQWRQKESLRLRKIQVDHKAKNRLEIEQTKLRKAIMVAKRRKAGRIHPALKNNTFSSVKKY